MFFFLTNLCNQTRLPDFKNEMSTEPYLSKRKPEPHFHIPGKVDDILPIETFTETNSKKDISESFIPIPKEDIKNMFIVDDEEDLLNNLANEFERLDVNVVKESNEDNAIRFLKENNDILYTVIKFDFIFLSFF